MSYGDIVPECRYGHGKLVAAKNEDDGILPAIYAAVHFERNPSQINMGRVYSFNVYECPVCSYVELHDSDPRKL